MSVTTSVLCVWCSRVMEWGHRGIAYDLCQACGPVFQNAVVLAELGSPGPAMRQRESRIKAAALG